MPWRKSKYLLPLIVLAAAVLYFLLDGTPAYTRWAVILLILPSIFFLCRKESRLEIRKVAAVCLTGMLGGILWDNIAIYTGIWNFPTASVSGWFLGIPYEEYVFAIGFTVIILGIYTSLPKIKHQSYDGPRLSELPLLMIMFAGQILVLIFAWHVTVQSYFAWLLYLAALPSLFYVWRKGEKIDETRMALTIGIILVGMYVGDVIFITSSSWYYLPSSLLGVVGVVPIDDLLFVIFSSICAVGIYTSLPNKRMLRGKW